MCKKLFFVRFSKRFGFGKNCYARYMDFDTNVGWIGSDFTASKDDADVILTDEQGLMRMQDLIAHPIRTKIDVD